MNHPTVMFLTLPISKPKCSCSAGAVSPDVVRVTVRLETTTWTESTPEQQFRDWHTGQKEAPQKTLETTIKGIS